MQKKTFLLTFAFQMIRKEILIFIVCLLTAFILWIVHQLNQTYIRPYHFNTNITQIPNIYEKDSDSIHLKITVKGSGLKIILLENYFPEKINIPFNKLKKLNKKGLFLIRTQSILENKSFPVKIKITELQPDTISIQLKSKKKK